jgi:hypothetical protein
MQTHLYDPMSSRQVPSFWHGFDSHSLKLISHRGPVNPAVQLQMNEPGVLTQIPPCSHGEPSSHSLMSSEQSTPLKPCGQEHSYSPVRTDVSQLASAWHGFEAHASSR